MRNFWIFYIPVIFFYFYLFIPNLAYTKNMLILYISFLFTIITNTYPEFWFEPTILCVWVLLLLRVPSTSIRARTKLNSPSLGLFSYNYILYSTFNIKYTHLFILRKTLYYSFHIYFITTKYCLINFYNVTTDYPIQLNKPYLNVSYQAYHKLTKAGSFTHLLRTQLQTYQSLCEMIICALHLRHPARGSTDHILTFTQGLQL